LSEQIRVHPQINNLLSTFHKRIADDFACLKNNSQIAGTTSNVYFLNHQNYDEVPDSISKNVINTIEAEFVTKFAFYLHQQDADFDPGNITILTPFTAQKELIKSLLAPELIKEKTVKISEIITKEVGMHNYEPEFAQKIIVTEKKLGSVNVQLISDYRYEENKIVILSLVAVPQRWQKEALTILSTKDLVYTALSRATRGLYIFGDGDLLKNIPPWTDIIKKTINEINVMLKCGHNVKVPCHERLNVDEYRCKRPKDVEIPTCGHVVRVDCFVTNPECTKRCGYLLSCGHKCEGSKFIKEAVRMWNVVKSQKKQNELTEEEKEQIIQAMDNEIQELYGDGDNVTGHWFCCPNGHPYYIATQRSVCNDCGAIIGGTGHIVVPSNSFYGEFDGSAAPAYPGQPARQPNREI
ncbi:3165_t:CDS:2, partial [Racocetra fulgida]